MSLERTGGMPPCQGGRGDFSCASVKRSMVAELVAGAALLMRRGESPVAGSSPAHGANGNTKTAR